MCTVQTVMYRLFFTYDRQTQFLYVYLYIMYNFVIDSLRPKIKTKAFKINARFYTSRTHGLFAWPSDLKFTPYLSDRSLFTYDKSRKFLVECLHVYCINLECSERVQNQLAKRRLGILRLRFSGCGECFCLLSVVLVYCFANNKH